LVFLGTLAAVRIAALLSWCCLALLACDGAPQAGPAAAPSVTPPPPSAAASTGGPPQPAPAAEAAPHFLIIEHARTPTARSQDGCVLLELDRESHSLRYRRGPDPSCQGFEQRLELVREMLDAFSAMGDLRKVTSFVLGRDYPAFFQRLALAAAASPAWDSRAGKPKGRGSEANNAFVVELAHEPSQFFPEVASVLQHVKLRAELGSVEKVLVGTPERTPFADALLAHGVAPKAKLPFDCIVAFRIAPVQ
jgi:hypothetical protein